MSLTTAAFTGLTGLVANSRQIDVAGDNIANVNTTAFKSSRMLFSTMFSQTRSNGTPPGDTTGGTNPFQVGLGVKTAGTQRNFTGGTINATGDQRDLAIDGDGFFMVQRDGANYFTRAGAFRQNAANELVTVNGERLQGYMVDENFNLVTGALTNLSIPVGSLTIAEATRNVRFSGNLNANGTLPTRGSLVEVRGTPTAGLRAVAGANPAPGAGNLIEATTRLLDVEDPLLPGTGSPIFQVGQAIELRGAEKGGRTLPAATLVIDTATTIGDLQTFLTQALGIDTSVTNPDGATPGVAIDPATGVLSITGNTGTVNDFDIAATDIRLLDTAGTYVRSPFVTNDAANADGESVRTSFIVYDSLGTPVSVDLTMVLAGRDSTGTQWRYFVESEGDSDLALQVGTGTLGFDTGGRLITSAIPPVVIDRAGTGAASPLQINLSFAGGEDNVTALTDDRSQIAATFRDGSALGTLAGFGIGADGIITGTFSNGLARTVGQVVLAKFTNNEGLSSIGDNLFIPTANSGNAVVITPGTLGAGQIVGGALEASNVDLGEEFIKLIMSSTGYSAASRVIRTADELMQQLLVLGR